MRAMKMRHLSSKAPINFHAQIAAANDVRAAASAQGKEWRERVQDAARAVCEAKGLARLFCFLAPIAREDFCERVKPRRNLCVCRDSAMVFVALLRRLHGDAHAAHRLLQPAARAHNAPPALVPKARGEQHARNRIDTRHIARVARERDKREHLGLIRAFLAIRQMQLEQALLERAATLDNEKAEIVLLQKPAFMRFLRELGEDADALCRVGIHERDVFWVALLGDVFLGANEDSARNHIHAVAGRVELRRCLAFGDEQRAIVEVIVWVVAVANRIDKRDSAPFCFGLHGDAACAHAIANHDVGAKAVEQRAIVCVESPRFIVREDGHGAVCANGVVVGDVVFFVVQHHGLRAARFELFFELGEIGCAAWAIEAKAAKNHDLDSLFGEAFEHCAALNCCAAACVMQAVRAHP